MLADGFLKHTRPMNRLLAWCYGRICANWALETFADLGAFAACLREHGFTEITVEDASLRLAPSVLHIPRVTLRFLWDELRTERLRMGRDVIARQLGQITRLVDDLLDVGRITSGKIHLESRPVDLAAVIGMAVESVEPAARSRGHRIDVQLPDEPAWVAGDEARLQQVVGNLLSNAVKFTDTGGQIQVSLRRSRESPGASGTTTRRWRGRPSSGQARPPQE